jgi:hypothetical protein
MNGNPWSCLLLLRRKLIGIVWRNGLTRRRTRGRNANQSRNAEADRENAHEGLIRPCRNE